MVNKKFIQQLKSDYDKYEEERRRIISLSNIVLHDSKRVIFSLQRGDLKKAEESLLATEKILNKLDKNFGHCRLSQEGAYKAAIEEYAEAKMFFCLLAGKKIDKIKDINIDVDGYLGGICDLTGELVRLAINNAAQGKFKEVDKIKKIINEIMVALVEFDMTGYVRTKYDQAKMNLKKIEQIDYEIKIRKR